MQERPALHRASALDSSPWPVVPFEHLRATSRVPGTYPFTIELKHGFIDALSGKKPFKIDNVKLELKINF